MENPELQLIFQEAEPSYVLPKRKYFIGNVFNQMYDQSRTKVQSELHSALGECWYWSIYCSHPLMYIFLGVCLTTDIWTFQSNEAYMTVTAHFVDIVGSRMKSFVLETTEFSGNYTADRTVERLENICIEWSILDKVVCLVSDTCNVMKKVGNDFCRGKFASFWMYTFEKYL